MKINIRKRFWKVAIYVSSLSAALGALAMHPCSVHFAIVIGIATGAYFKQRKTVHED